MIEKINKMKKKLKKSGLKTSKKDFFKLLNRTTESHYIKDDRTKESQKIDDYNEKQTRQRKAEDASD